MSLVERGLLATLMSAKSQSDEAYRGGHTRPQPTAQHRAHASGEAHRIEEQRAAYATGTTGTVTAAVLLMEQETVRS